MSDNIKQYKCSYCNDRGFNHFWFISNSFPIGCSDTVQEQTAYSNGKCIGVPCKLCNDRDLRLVILYTGKDFNPEYPNMKKWRLY
jgi:hypothetical protein